jgi:WD40 repeat protein
MAVGRILRKSLVKELEITGQQVVSGEYQEAINKFETVAQLIPFENPDVKVKLPNPDILPTGSGRRTAFSPDDTYLAVAHNTSPFIAIYKRSGDTFTKLANPDILPTGTGFGTAFSPDSTYLAVGHSNTPFITIYKRSGDTFTKLANPDTLPPAQSQHGGSVDFSPNGTYLALSYFAFPSVNPK